MIDSKINRNDIVQLFLNNDFIDKDEAEFIKRNPLGTENFTQDFFNEFLVDPPELPDIIIP